MPSPSKKRAKKAQDSVDRISSLVNGLENDLPEKVASLEPSALYKSVLDMWKTKNLEAAVISVKQLPMIFFGD